MSTKDDGGPAFPTPGLSSLPNGEFIHPMTGMGLRDYFAAKAMQAMISTSNGPCLNGLDGYEFITSNAAYKIADAMLEARAK